MLPFRGNRRSGASGGHFTAFPCLHGPPPWAVANARVGNNVNQSNGDFVMTKTAITKTPNLEARYAQR